MDDIRGRTVAITGAARGIGYATAKALLARGARVVIGDRDVAGSSRRWPGLSRWARCRATCSSTVTNRSYSRPSWTRPAPMALGTSTC